ncbi:MAG: tetratricopeptide repeat protein [Deltaproteobacteria bacterium]|nr:tetratricopeptide repeat protein [Deltaproteobacteria bacterium]
MKFIGIFVIISGLFFSFEARGEKLFCPTPTSDAEMNKKNAKTYFQMGKVFENQGDFIKFMEAFDCVLKLVPSSAGARYQYATALDKLGQYTKASIHYQILLTSDQVKVDKNFVAKIQKRLGEIKGLKDKKLKTPDGDKKPVDTKVIDKNAQDAQRKVDELQKKFEKLSEAVAKGGVSEKEMAEIKRVLQETQAQLKASNKKLEEYQTKGKNNPPDGTKITLPEKKPVKKNYTKMSKIGLSVVGVGVLVGVLGAGANVFAYMEKESVFQPTADDSKINRCFVKPGETCPAPDSINLLWADSEAKTHYDNYKTAMTASIALYITAGALAVTGAVLYFVGGGKEPVVEGKTSVNSDSAGSVMIMPFPLENGGGIGLSGKF